LVEAITTHVGPGTASGLRAAFGLTDEETIQRLFVEAGFENVRVVATGIDLELPAVREFVPKHIAATPMSAGWSSAGSEQQDAALRHIERQTDGLRTDGGMRVPFWSYFITAGR